MTIALGLWGMAIALVVVNLIKILIIMEKIIKIFEKREYIDGGPNDNGFVIGYIKTNKSKEQLRKEEEIQKENDLEKASLLSERIKKMKNLVNF